MRTVIVYLRTVLIRECYSDHVTIRPASDRSLLISFGEEISLETHLAVARLTRCLEGVRGILNLHPAYASVLVDFDPRLRRTPKSKRWCASGSPAPRRGAAPAAHRRNPRALRRRSRSRPGRRRAAHRPQRRSASSNCIRAAEYLVYFVGFATCFPYLGGLPPELATPRLSAPRKQVPAGSVAIGGAQAGVYPLASPGRLAADRPHRPAALRPDGRAAAAAAHGRPRPLRSCGGAVNRIHVLSPGMLTTVQDLGRFGWAHFGISASGAADPLALRAAICWSAMRRTPRRSR